MPREQKRNPMPSSPHFHQSPSLGLIRLHQVRSNVTSGAVKQDKVGRWFLVSSGDQSWTLDDANEGFVVSVVVVARRSALEPSRAA